MDSYLQDNLPISMVVTDLDGTLLRDDKTVSQTDIDTLHRLGELNVCRVAATGRTLYNTQILPADFPFDYVIFSSGSGILNWKTKELIMSLRIDANLVDRITVILNQLNLNFNIYKPIPDNHHFLHFDNGMGNEDFDLLLKHYSEFLISSENVSNSFGDACQFLVILPYDVGLFESIKQQIQGVKIVRATSPIRGKYFWMELFNHQVSKGNAVAWLCNHLNIMPHKTIGLGNDYNDLDLLRFTNLSYVVSNAPHDLQQQFAVTVSNMESPLTTIVRKHLNLN